MQPTNPLLSRDDRPNSQESASKLPLIKATRPTKPPWSLKHIMYIGRQKLTACWLIDWKLKLKKRSRWSTRHVSGGGGPRFHPRNKKLLLLAKFGLWLRRGDVDWLIIAGAPLSFPRPSSFCSPRSPPRARACRIKTCCGLLHIMRERQLLSISC